MKKFLVVLAYLLAVCATVDAATYYVSPSGNDSNPGTEALPWQTIKKAAQFALQPGDTVLIHTGEYSGAGFRFKKAGTAVSPITYKAYGDGEVRITNSTIVPSGSWTWVQGAIYSAPFTGTVSSVFQNAIPLQEPDDNAITITNINQMVPNSFFKSGTTVYVWLEDSSNPNDSVMRFSPGHVIELENCHYSIFDGLTVEYGYNGFKDQGTETHHVIYRNNTIRSIRSQGIQPVPASSIIEANHFRMIGTNKYLHGIYTSQPGTIIRYNLFEEIAGAAIHLYGSNPGGGNFQIYGNVSRKPRRMTVPTTGNRYYTDYIIWAAGSNLIYNNVIAGEGLRGGMDVNSPNNKIFNNTFIEVKGAVSFNPNKPGNQVTNNIIIRSGTSEFIAWPSTAGAQTLDYNLYYRPSGTLKWQHLGVNYTNFAAYQAASGETHSLYADPLLVPSTDAHLQDGSPAIDAGTPLAEFTIDADGEPRPQGLAYDMGAKEYVPAEEKLTPAIVADSGNLTAVQPSHNLLDNCTTDAPDCKAGAGNIASYWVIFDLGEPTDVTRARLFGDNTGTWLSASWSLDVACEVGGPWTPAFSQQPSLGTQWFEQPVEVKGRYVRLTVNGNLAFQPGRTEAREFEVYGRQPAVCG